MNKWQAKIPSTREELHAAARVRILEQLRTLDYASAMGRDRLPYKNALKNELDDIIDEIDHRLAEFDLMNGKATRDR